jgi:uncharacterized membrane protein
MLPLTCLIVSMVYVMYSSLRSFGVNTIVPFAVPLILAFHTAAFGFVGTVVLLLGALTGVSFGEQHSTTLVPEEFDEPVLTATSSVVKRYVCV